ncbi:helix-turn-helix domain-containing protein [Streptomyces sp. NPDC059949]|uniref:helix-turn-helix domain-containing protein n=1 Tax=Streptomyces sp. NPDC059949 TaxID=3347013 RepID=UPI00365DADBA
MPAPDGPRLLPDGSVVVPARLASTVFAATTLYLATRTRTSGGALNPEARTLLRALHLATQGPSRVSDTSPDDSRIVSPGYGFLLGVAEAADLLGCHPSYVRRLCHTGALPAQRITGGWVIEAAALDDYRHGSRAHGKPRPTPTT